MKLVWLALFAGAKKIKAREMNEKKWKVSWSEFARAEGALPHNPPKEQDKPAQEFN